MKHINIKLIQTCSLAMTHGKMVASSVLREINSQTEEMVGVGM